MGYNVTIGYFSSPPLVRFHDGNWHGPVVDFLNQHVLDGFDVDEFEYDFDRLYATHADANEFFVGIFDTKDRHETFRFSVPLLWFPVFLVDGEGVLCEPDSLNPNSTCYVEAFDLGSSVIASLANSIRPRVMKYDYARDGLPKLRPAANEFFIGDSLTLWNRFRSQGVEVVFDASKALTRVSFSVVIGGAVNQEIVATINERISRSRPVLLKAISNASDVDPELGLLG